MNLSCGGSSPNEGGDGAMGHDVSRVNCSVTVLQWSQISSGVGCIVSSLASRTFAKYFSLLAVLPRRLLLQKGESF